MNEGDLRNELQRLWDLEHIKRLKYDYCYYGDWTTNGMVDIDKFSRLFSEDAKWDVGLGACVGRAAIAAHCKTLTFSWAHGIHYAINPRIDLDGDRATGTWHLLGPLVRDGDQYPFWQSGVYYEQYIRTKDGWRIQEMSLRHFFVKSDAE